MITTLIKCLEMTQVVEVDYWKQGNDLSSLKSVDASCVPYFATNAKRLCEQSRSSKGELQVCERMPYLSFME